VLVVEPCGFRRFKLRPGFWRENAPPGLREHRVPRIIKQRGLDQFIDSTGSVCLQQDRILIVDGTATERHAGYRNAATAGDSARALRLRIVICQDFVQSAQLGRPGHGWLLRPSLANYSAARWRRRPEERSGQAEDHCSHEKYDRRETRRIPPQLLERGVRQGE
jgi:hypothetical protein